MTDRITHLLQLESKAKEGPWKLEKGINRENSITIIGGGEWCIADMVGYMDEDENGEEHAEFICESRNSIKEVLELLVEAEEKLQMANIMVCPGEPKDEIEAVLDKINKFRKGS